MTHDRDIDNLTTRLGITRRTFMTFCTGMAATLGLPGGAAIQLAHAVAQQRRPSVIWLSGQECTGCTESLLRSTHPTLETLILDQISLDYSEALCAAAGHQAEAAKHSAMKENWGKYLLVVEGSIPTKDGGIYCKIAGKTILEHVQEAAEGAAAIVAIGSCASWGGVPSAGPNPTGATPVHEVLPDKTIINIPGCPPNPYNFLSTVMQYLTYGTLPELDDLNRPKFAYGRLIHENCERRAHFDAGRFATEFGDEGHRAGWCLYKLGCKGPETYANCPSIEFGDVGGGAWPVGVGAPCFGCTEKGVGFEKALYDRAKVTTHTPPDMFPPVAPEVGEGASVGAAALLGAVAGAVIGASAMTVRQLGRSEQSESSSPSEDR
ncbi:hydrogenase small subunit [Aestuariirhabdus sp. Z084]|uniref:hydrogenase small subunit n=1 Tax=Aestuariirhabdus haliotis TaxID=2918751 RepID=UPI00201B44C1|nr:hydrogenase small subunit [Aestuariirhabdus haliotis]MCL6415146.1 hydrogenase small subunit [Aestuariirhabdus haliotis]MCL6420021.1 hydrogenase small subunit [Aestuariirhabdus haliotis]